MSCLEGDTLLKEI